MYARNNASPERLAIGSIYLIADGTIQTSGASVRVMPQGGAASGGGGTLACDATSGVWHYIPTQAETNYTSFMVAVYKASCTTACITIVTSAESTAGKVSLGSAQTASITGSLSGSVGSVTGAVGSVVGHTPQTGDSFARLGAPAGASIAADVAAIPTTPMRGTDGAYTGTPPTAAAIADAVFDEATADHTIAGTYGRLLGTTWKTLFSGITSLAEWLGLMAGKQAGDATARTEIRATGAASGTFLETTDSLEALRDNQQDAGSGARTVTVMVDDGSDALESARVRYTKGAESYVQTTDASGNATFSLDDGTWTVAITLPLYTFTQTTLVVDGNETPTYSMAAISVTPPASPTDCACAWLCLDDDDAAVAGVVIRARPDTDASGTGYAWSGKTRSATSVAVTGMATINLPQGSKWWIRRDSGEEELFTVPSESTSTTVVSVRGGKRDTY